MAPSPRRAKFEEAISGGAARARKRLRIAWLPLLQVTVAATLAWFIAHTVLDHPQPFFAPIAAILSLSVSLGQRGRRAIEMMVGVVVGILIAIATISLFGTGAVQIGVAVGLSMAIAVFLGGGVMLVNQSGASAAIVVALGASEAGAERIFDAAIGGAIALIFSQLLFPPKPLGIILPARRDAVLSMSDGLAQLAEALREPDGEHIGWTLRTAGRIHDKLAKLAAARLLASEIAHTSPARRQDIPLVDRSADVAIVIDLLANATLTVIRDIVRLVDDGDEHPQWLPEVLDVLATGLEELAADETVGLDPGPGATACQEAGLSGARMAANHGERGHDWRERRIARDIRSVCVDMLRVSGTERRTALTMISSAWRGIAAGPATGEIPLQPAGDPG